MSNFSIGLLGLCAFGIAALLLGIYDDRRKEQQRRREQNKSATPA
jgi:predicted outer membrane lipoprotein